MTNVKVCPRCGNEETQVFEARVFHGVFRRRRICTKCKYKYDTAEIMFWDAVMEDATMKIPALAHIPAVPDHGEEGR